MVPRELEQHAHQLLRVAAVLAHDARRRDVEKRGLALRGHGLCQHGFPRSGRAVQQDALPGAQEAREQLRVLDRHDHGLFQQALRRPQAHHVVPGHPRVRLEDVACDGLRQAPEVGVPRKGQRLQQPVFDGLGVVGHSFGVAPVPHRHRTHAQTEVRVPAANPVVFAAATAAAAAAATQTFHRGTSLHLGAEFGLHAPQLLARHSSIGSCCHVFFRLGHRKAVCFWGSSAALGRPRPGAPLVASVLLCHHLGIDFSDKFGLFTHLKLVVCFVLSQD
mmetsp:Transcript_58469/g.117395  ORF Transcript_58469/g.117395 Transcript_58469/m.117395 type:complete len:276 (-) Transcript_58469:381-1208(-)